MPFFTKTVNFCFKLASLACDGVTGAVQDHTRSHYITEKWTMMFYMNLFATLFLAVTILISGELFKFVNFIGDYPFVLNDMFMFAISGAAGQVFVVVFLLTNCPVHFYILQLDHVPYIDKQ